MKFKLLIFVLIFSYSATNMSAGFLDTLTGAIDSATKLTKGVVDLGTAVVGDGKKDSSSDTKTKKKNPFTTTSSDKTIDMTPNTPRTDKNDSYRLVYQIQNDYKENMIRGGKKWLYKKIKLNVTFSRLGKIRSDIIMYTNIESSQGLDDYPISITCDNIDIDELQQLNIGDIIEIEGTVKFTSNIANPNKVRLNDVRIIG